MLPNGERAIRESAWTGCARRKVRRENGAHFVLLFESSVPRARQLCVPKHTSLLCPAPSDDIQYYRVSSISECRSVLKDSLAAHPTQFWLKNVRFSRAWEPLDAVPIPSMAKQHA